jgi:hypothetical protein
METFENPEQYLKSAKSINISVDEYIKLMDMKLDADNHVERTIYRKRELVYRAFDRCIIGIDELGFSKGTLILTDFEITNYRDTQWFELMDNLK